LDLLLVVSANPEDYTNRGRIITPLKDRFGAEIRTHYPLDLDLEIDLIRQEAQLAAAVPAHLVELVARFTRAVRESPSVDARSGVSARFAIAAAETVAAGALRRSGLLDERDAVARVGDNASVASTLRGEVGVESGEEGRGVEDQGQRQSRTAPHCGPAADCSTRFSTCCAGGLRAAAAWTTWPRVRAGCAARRCAAAISTARSPGPAPCSTRPSRRNGTSWPAGTTKQ